MTNVLTLIETSSTGELRNTVPRIAGHRGQARHAGGCCGGGAGGWNRPHRRARFPSAPSRNTWLRASGWALLATPQVEALASALSALEPAIVVVANSVEGRDVAARLAVRTGAGLVIDAIDVRSENGKVIATHSVFGGAYTVESTSEGGLAIVTVRQVRSRTGLLPLPRR